jgi:lysozyme family protein
MTFEQCIPYILKYEGGYSYDMRDSGGETAFGISKRAYPHLEIQFLTKEEAIEIYRKDYWDKIRGDELPEMIRLVVLNSAVNQGVFFAIKVLQKMLKVSQDGKLGPKTMLALREINPRSLKYEFLRLQAEHYFSLNKPEFLKGWILRLIDCSQY